MGDRHWRRILTTGAAGRIGRTLRQGLAGRAALLRLSDIHPPAPAGPGEEVMTADICDPVAMDAAMQGVEALVHLAGAPDPADHDLMYRTNVQGLWTVFDAARRAGVKRIVFASTNHVFGMYPVAETVTPDHPPRPDSMYGATKAFGETLLRWLWEKQDIESVALRIGTFRPEPHDQRSLATWLSPADMVRLADRALHQQAVGCRVVLGFSANTRLRVRDPGWAAIGYAPEDDAERHRERLRQAGVDVDGPPEWPIHGGDYLNPTY